MRKRILLLTLSTTFLVVLAFVIPLAILVSSETSQRARVDLQNQAQFTAFSARSTSTTTTIADYIADADASHDTSTLVIWMGQRIGSLPPGVRVDDLVITPDAEPTSSQANPGGPPGGPGSGPRKVAGGEVAVAVNRERDTSDTQVTQVFVYASNGSLSDGATGWFALLGGASAFLLLLTAAAAVFVSRRISAPLTATAEAAHRLSAGDIDARAPTTGPREVADVGQALNRLAGRIDELIDEERETVADLSHRMRTPLTALRLDADTLRDPDESERIGEHAATLERTLTAVIRSARRAEREGLVPSCDATAVVAERTEFWSPLAEDQGRRVDVVLPPRPVAVRAAASDLAAAVDALVENVLAHTPEGTDFRVDLTATTTGADLVVSDRGPGIPPGAGVRGRSDRGSTGLGLSIAARCAENSGGSFAVEQPDGGGGVVRLVLGAP